MLAMAATARAARISAEFAGTGTGTWRARKFQLLTPRPTHFGGPSMTKTQPQADDLLRHREASKPRRLHKRSGFRRLAMAALAQAKQREKALEILRSRTP
jgi:hypothetical protein